MLTLICSLRVSRRRRGRPLPSGRLVAAGLRKLELCDEKGKVLPARKGDPRKVALATLLRTRTTTGNEWSQSGSKWAMTSP